MDNDKDVELLNSIGNITNSTIANIVQTIKNSIEIPDDLKDLLITCLLLFKENHEWQKEQRLKAQKENWQKEKADFYRKCAKNWAAIICFTGISIALITLVCLHLYPIYALIRTNSNGAIFYDIVSFIKATELDSQRFWVISFIITLFIMLFSWFSGGRIAQRVANKKYGKYYRSL